MKKCIVRAMGIVLTAGIIITSVAVQKNVVSADAVTGTSKYIAFGADLNAKEKAAVLDGFGITKDNLSDYKTIEITNKDEHDYLGDYMSDSVIGTRALSSVMVVKADDNSGVNVSTKHITYCTAGMYCNALVTAGLSDANVTVVGPFDISGTSALVGAMKAYSVMTGEEISEKTMDTATDELVTTAEVAKNVGDKQKVTELVAAAKKAVFEDQLSSETDIRDAIEQAASELGLDNLSDDDVQKLTNMMMKVSKEDIDPDKIAKQASDIYNKLKEKGIDLANVDTKGLGEKIGDFFGNIFTAIANFFTGLFG